MTDPVLNVVYHFQEEIAEFLGSVISQLSNSGGVGSGEDRRKQARRRKSSKEYTPRVSGAPHPYENHHSLVLTLH